MINYKDPIILPHLQQLLAEGQELIHDEGHWEILLISALLQRVVNLEERLNEICSDR
jgi:hypothetical protein